MADRINVALPAALAAAKPLPRIAAVPAKPSADETKDGTAVPSRSGNSSRLVNTVAAQTAMSPARQVSTAQVPRAVAAQRAATQTSRATTPARTNTGGIASAAPQVRQAVQSAQRAPLTRDTAGNIVSTRPTALPSRDQNNMADNRFGMVRQVDADYGVGGSSRNPIGKSVYARGGGIEGPVEIPKTFTIAVNDTGTQAISLTTALASADQAITGSERYIYQLSLSANVSGSIPTGFDANSLQANILSGSRVQILVGGVIKAIYGTQQLLDTNFIQRGLDVDIYPDPGNFASTSFVLEKPSQFFPAAGAGLTYNFFGNLNTYWSNPGAIKL